MSIIEKKVGESAGSYENSSEKKATEQKEGSFRDALSELAEMITCDSDKKLTLAALSKYGVDVSSSKMFSCLFDADSDDKITFGEISELFINPGNGEEDVAGVLETIAFMKSTKLQMQEEFLKKVFDAIDTNKDQAVSKVELMKGLHSANKIDLQKCLGKNFFFLFNKQDADDSGNINFEEFKSWAAEMEKRANAMAARMNKEKMKAKQEEFLKKVFDAIDVNKDQAVTKVEIMKALQSANKKDLQECLGKNFFFLFNKQDADNSGNINFEEFKSWAAEMKRRAKRLARELKTEEFLKQVFDEIDVNKDQAVSKVELMKALEAANKQDLQACLGKKFFKYPQSRAPTRFFLFHKHDADESGDINFDEFKSWALEMKKREDEATEM